jgi:hypothetical protein
MDMSISGLNIASATVIALLDSESRVVATDAAMIAPFIDNGGSVSAWPAIHVELTVVDDERMRTISGAGLAVPSVMPGLEGPEVTPKTVVLTWPIWKIFIGSYLPVLLAAILKMFWTPIHANAKIMQPFISMAWPEGAPAQKVFFSDYLSSSLNPIQTIMEASWLTFSTTMNIGLIALLALLSSEAIYLDTNYDCPNKDPTKENPCWPPRLSADPYVIRVLQALLSIVAAITFLAMWAAVRSPRPLYMDPSCFAGVASLMHHPAILHDLQSTEPDASLAEVKQEYPDRHYSLQHHNDADGQWRYSIVPIIAGDDCVQPTAAGSLSDQSCFQHNISDHADMLLRISTIILLLGLMGLTVAYFRDHSNSVFNNFFNSNAFGPRFILTTVATLASSAFMTMYQGEIRPKQAEKYR